MQSIEHHKGKARTPTQALQETLTLLENPTRWIKGEAARNEAGEDLGWGYSRHAVCFCVEGAIQYVTQEATLYQETIRILKNFLGVPQVYKWNDAPERQHSEVVGALRDAVLSILS